MLIWFKGRGSNNHDTQIVLSWKTDSSPHHYITPVIGHGRWYEFAARKYFEILSRNLKVDQVNLFSIKCFQIEF